MAQIENIGTGQTYTTLAAWVASPDYSTDWGVGNPATARIVGTVTGNTTVNAGNPPNGAVIEAFPGQEYDGTNSATSAKLISSGITLSLRDQGITVRDLFIESTGAGQTALFLGQFESVDSVAERIGIKAESTNNNSTAMQTYSGGTFNGTMNNIVVEGAGGYGLWLRNHCINGLGSHTVYNANQSNNGFRQGVRSDNSSNVIINSFVERATGAPSTDFGGSWAAGADYNASSDTSSPGSNSFDGRSAATDLVNVGSGDFRTKASSPLATGGQGGTFIGAFLESGGGGGVTSSVSFDIPSPTFSINSTVTQPATTATVSFGIPSPEFSVSASATSPVFNAAISFDVAAPVFSVTGSNTRPIFNGSVSFDVATPQFSVSASVTQPGFSSSVSFDVPAPTFGISASVTLPTFSASVGFIVPAPTFFITNIPLEADFTGVLKSASFSGILAQTEFIGVDKVSEFSGQLKAKQEFTGIEKKSIFTGIYNGNS